ncbi:phosphoglucomutase 1 [Macrolepiota fuliginosa MF-IS2]|uniref:Phosphoglucomutase 1 n=1 Tax=Macrolepiota fuliginosa MF-IS2 TaxID=1400762 RepID=A0A9P6C935_9AGAR|nr:phosphoglucomutase 1 [Macrolepiota fuliginosa MF-IS2]
MAELSQLVSKWLEFDRNPVTRAEIQGLRDSGNIQELESRMRHRIEFGTAGLRGRMEAGWARMNDLIIIQASQGLAAYVIKQVPDALSRGVVIGHDHRHNSEQWAKLTAAAFLAKDVKVYLLRGLVHTPMVPFSVKRLRAACGVMITASHNPKQDNGYKVYWENAVQIIEPHDGGISESIKANLTPDTWDTSNVTSSSLSVDITQEMHDAYFTSLSSLLVDRQMNRTTSVRFVNTSMHGVSDPYVKRAFETFGFAPYIPVKEQQQPDPEFPTVRFPNPEEKGALDLALAAAEREGISYVLAQDPDSDRFSGAERDSNGTWTVFTGDQLGSLFASHILKTYKSTGKPLDKLAMVASTVSSKMIEAMAEVEGFKFAQCLTGFKYIGNTGLDLVKAGYEVPFGYEEAIGFMFGDQIRDKDGVAATMTFVQLVATLNAQGKTLKGHLQGLYEKYGYFQTNNGYFICNDPPTIDRIFARIRNFDSSTSPSYPKQIAGLSITSIVDLTTGYDSTNPPTYKPSLPLSSGHMIQFRAQNSSAMKIVLTTRTSGTEPKIKYYLEGSGKDNEAVKVLLVQVIQELGDVWLEASKHGLGKS